MLKKVGLRSGREVDRALKTVNTIDELIEEGRTEDADLIRGVLNNGSVSAAENLARNIDEVKIPDEDKPLIKSGKKSPNSYIEKVSEITDFSKQLEDRKQYLIEKIHDVDLELVDIEHAAEFYQLDVVKGYKIYKILHDTLNKRRDYKNEFKKIDYLLGTSIKSDKLENLKSKIIGLDNQLYTPRINKELFGV